MASTYTPLGIELQATGENAGTWGTKTNTNLQIVEQISGGFTTQAVSDSGDTTLSVSDGSTGATLSHRIIEFTGSLTASRNVTIPLDVQNFYILKNHGIRDENGNEQLFFSTTSSAVNYVNVTNAATGGDPKVAAAGDDSNVDLALAPKGSGEIVVGTGSAASTITSSGAYDLVLDTNSGTNSGNITITDGSNGNITATPNGTGVVAIGGNTNPGTIQLNCESNSHGIKLQSPPHSSSQSYTLKFPTGNVTADRFLKVDSITGSGTTAVGQLSFGEVSGGTSWQAVKTSGFTAVAGEGYFCNTTSAAFTVTLPSSATQGDEVSIIDYAGTFDTNNLTIGRNSHNIQGSAADLTVSTERAGFTLVYVDSTQGWLLKDK
jgi:hypothetical protein